MTGSPYISVVMPVRNEERYLEAALDSLFRQTVDDWELIAVDDGSTDRTGAILEAAAHRDPRVRPLRREGGGLVAALNAGMALCRGELVARMDGDDISHPRRFERQAAHLEAHPETGLVAAEFRHFPRHSLRRGMADYERWQNGLSSHELILRDLFVESPFVHPGVMLRRSLLERAGGYRDLGWAEDYDLWLRLAAQGVRFARLPGPLIFWRDHPERATRTMDDYAAHAMRACKLHHLRRGFLAGAGEVVLAGAGREARAWQRLLDAEGIRVGHWLDIDPKKLGRTLHGAPVIRPQELELAGRKMLCAIGLRGAREAFRGTAQGIGWKEGVDFVCVA
ncbi:glycosyltransferase [Geomonas sp. Red32]|uniref:glycosyltransferase family 2 protein n=1 Tax=Geomonas sp. Red32 TaxID=2912856 RepID=UPI00202CAA78|nr:glycosyltransferase [Geomonas sp. Red32]MCM0082251.1 glycosyltransferase [Geomonas sp. Red32]